MRRTVLIFLLMMVIGTVGEAASAQDPTIPEPEPGRQVLEPFVPSEATKRCDGGPCGGTGSRDVIFGSGKADEIRAGGGKDGVDAEGGDDLAYGGSGADTLFGGYGDDALRGKDGKDDLDDSEGADHDELFGGAGDDLVIVEDNDGNDTVRCGAGEGDYVYADPEDDVAADCETVTRL